MEWWMTTASAYRWPVFQFLTSVIRHVDTFTALDN